MPAANGTLVQNHNLSLPGPEGNTSAESRAVTGNPNSTKNPEPPVNASRCQLNLDTDPEGALIYVDGLYLGKTTPYAIDVEAGTSHKIRFELRGYHPAETTVTPFNSTCIRTSLYNPVHTTKGRLPEEPGDPERDPAWRTVYHLPAERRLDLYQRG